MVRTPISSRTGADVLHGRVVVGREHEADAHVLDALRDLRRRGAVCSRPAPPWHVGAARCALTLRPPCLLTLAPAAAMTKGGAGGDVEGAGTVAARAHDVHQVRGVGHLTLPRELAHDLRAAVISPMVSFFTRRPVTMAAVMTGESSPLMIMRIRCSISS